MKRITATAYTRPFADCIAASTPAPTETEALGIVSDPRRWDLPENTDVWSRILSDAYALDGADPLGVFGALHGIRCLGAGLGYTRWGFRIGPGEIGRTEYRALRELYLTPHAVAIRGLLARLDQENIMHKVILLSAYQ